MGDRVLWTPSAFLEATGGRLVGEAGPISGLSIDSRAVGNGEAFFAIKGDRFDGHDFVADALAKGAALAVVAESRAEVLAGTGPLVIVQDGPLAALERLAKAARARSRAKIVAVTGSVGKTGTKEALRLAFEAQGETHASTASFNNHWGVPLSLARLPETAVFAVFEIGMNHAGEITPLTRLVRPHAAIVTTIEPVHLEFFPSVEAIAEAKAEIFLGLEPDGIAILNRDNPHYDVLAARARDAGASRVIGFGEHPEADARAVKISLNGVGVCVSAVIDGEPITYKTGAPGRHIAVNSLAVLAAARTLGADLALAGLALASASAPKGRGERHALLVRGQPVTLIDESYNANPASMRAAISLLGDAKPALRGRRIAVLGDMLELGEAGPSFHAALAEQIDRAGVDLVYAAGPLMATLWEALPQSRRGRYAATASGLETALLASVGPGDVIMVKGSLGSRMGPLVEALKKRFPPARTEDADPA